MINKRISSFLSNRATAIISLIILTVLTLYLSSIDNKLSSYNNGVFALQTSFSVEQFTSVFTSWGPRGVPLFTRYLTVDILFALCYAIVFPSIILLMFTQLKKMAEALNLSISSSYEKITSIIIVFPASAAFCNILSDILLLKIIHSSRIHTYLIMMSASFQFIKFFFLGTSLIYLFILLIRRRRLYRKLR